MPAAEHTQAGKWLQAGSTRAGSALLGSAVSQQSGLKQASGFKQAFPQQEASNAACRCSFPVVRPSNSPHPPGVVCVCVLQLYIKTSALFRVSEQPYLYADAMNGLAALVQAYGAQRVMWGSDWPWVIEKCG